MNVERLTSMYQVKVSKNLGKNNSYNFSSTEKKEKNITFINRILHNHLSIELGAIHFKENFSNFNNTKIRPKPGRVYLLRWK